MDNKGLFVFLSHHLEWEKKQEKVAGMLITL